MVKLENLKPGFLIFAFFLICVNQMYAIWKPDNKIELDSYAVFMNNMWLGFTFSLQN